jgi:hypothetical protein
MADEEDDDLWGSGDDSGNDDQVSVPPEQRR